MAVDRSSNIVLHGSCSTVWHKVEDGGGSFSSDEEDSDDSSSGDPGAAAATTAYVPRCVCALSFDPLFDTLRAVALARGGYPEAGRALMVGGGGGEGGTGGGRGAGGTGGEPAAAAGQDDHGRSSSSGGGRSKDEAGKVAGGVGAVDEEEGSKEGSLEWGLGDTATLKAGRPPLPILPPPPPGQGPTLPTLFAPSTVRDAPGSGGRGERLDVPPLVQSISAPDSMGWSSAGEGGWSTEEEGTRQEQAPGPGRGATTPGAGGWSSFGLPPLVPLDHPVEPLFQVRVKGVGCGVELVG